MKWLISLSLFLLIPLATMAKSQQVDEIRSGDSLPNFSVKSNQGKTVSNSSLLGKPSVIIFFHTHCWDCRRELPVLQNLYEQYRRKYTFLCISRGESEPEVSAYWQNNGLTLPYSAQNDKEIFLRFARKGIPRVYVCDDRGVVRKVYKERVRKRRLARILKKIDLCSKNK